MYPNKGRLLRKRESPVEGGFCQGWVGCQEGMAEKERLLGWVCRLRIQEDLEGLAQVAVS